MLIQMENISRNYTLGNRSVEALRGIDLAVDTGESVAIVGPSGSGKSTLLHLLGCLDVPTAGRYRLDGQPVESMGERNRTALRRKTVGFVFQGFRLLPYLTAAENVELPLFYQGVPGNRRRVLAEEALERVGLSHRRHHKPGELSGGQQQRVALARAMVGKPPLLLADEPTGNLDPQAGQGVMDLLTDWSREGHTVVLITHDRELAARCGRRLTLADGRLSEG